MEVHFEDGISWLSLGVVISPGNIEQDSDSVLHPSVVYDNDREYYVMYYEGVDSDGLSYIIRSVSEDLASWTNFSEVLAPSSSFVRGPGEPFVLYDGFVYRMWFIGRSNYSQDNILFFSHKILLFPH